jgi:formylglycine-generating enzyme required for sulfatase activity
MPPQSITSHPVTYVNYDDATAYARFVGGRLPTYEEWIYAAFEDTPYPYPWGRVFSVDNCNVRESKKMGTTPVGLYSPQGDSPIGCVDMIGNVWEWTSTAVNESGGMFLAMGTGWDHYSRQLEIPLDRGYRNHSVGFRVVKDMA